MARIAAFLTARSPVLMVLSVLTGLAIPDLAALLRPWVVPVSIFMVPLSLLRVDARALLAASRLPVRMVLACGAVLVAWPLAVGGAAMAAGLPHWLAAGLVLIAAAPPLSASTAFAILLRIAPAPVTALSLWATILAPITLTLVALAVPGMADGIVVAGPALRLAGIIAGALVIALALRRGLGTARLDRAASGIDAAIVLLVLVIGIGVMHEIGAALRADPARAAALFAATWALSILSCAAGALAFWWAGRDFALAVGTVAAVKNVALMVAAIAAAAEPRVLLVVMTAQLPIFFAPLVLRPVFARLGRIGGRRTGA